MAGLFTASVVSGRRITTTGRYKRFPIAGTGITAVGLALLSTLGLDTPYWRMALFMLTLGVGIGLVMQVIVLAMQNSVGPRDMGVATSSATFFRSWAAPSARRCSGPSWPTGSPPNWRRGYPRRRCMESTRGS